MVSLRIDNLGGSKIVILEGKNDINMWNALNDLEAVVRYNHIHSAAEMFVLKEEYAKLLFEEYARIYGNKEV